MMTKEERRAQRDEAIRKRGTWRPTPTQEENDLAALGVPHDEIKKEPSGAPPDPATEANREAMRGRDREMRPTKDPRGGYVTK